MPSSSSASRISATARWYGGRRPAPRFAPLVAAITGDLERGAGAVGGLEAELVERRLQRLRVARAREGRAADGVDGRGLLGQRLLLQDRLGRAGDLHASCGSLPCSCSASIFVILPPLTVTRTWALPYCVAIGVAGRGACDGRRAADERAVRRRRVVVVAVAVVAARSTAVAVWTRRARAAWKARTPAVPATVAVEDDGGIGAWWLRVRR